MRETIEKRRSVRTYDGRPLAEEHKAKLMECAESLSNPFGVPVTVRLLATETASSQKMGTYGVIKGTKTFLGVTVPKGGLSLEAAGYSFEQLVLYAASLGVGTCWLAATVGICANHLCLSAQTLGLTGTLTRSSEPKRTHAPKDYRYLFSWISREDAQ